MSSRGDVSSLIQRMKKACRRPLFSEIVRDGEKQHVPYNKKQQQDGFSSNVETSSLSSSLHYKRPRREDSTIQNCQWEQLVNNAAQMLPFITVQEQGEISRLVSILLLGFILPDSTGNEFFLLQNVHSSGDYRTITSTAASINSDKDMADYIIQMPLEERLNNTCRRYDSNETSDLEMLTDASLDLAFDSFLRRGLAPFLGARPAHQQEVDILHILAMAIHPQPSPSHIPDTAEYLDETYFWQRAKKLMTCLPSHCFHVNYGHRFHLVQLVVKNLVLPKFNYADSSPLFHGAVQHVRASLHAFAQSAMSPYDAHWAHMALVTIAIQTGMEVVLKEEWDYLLHRMLDDRIDYGFNSFNCRKKSAPVISCWSFMFTTIQQEEDSFCPHTSRGWLLAHFLTRYQLSRHRSSGEFLQLALSSLTDAIEWQVHCWTKPPTEDENQAQPKFDDPPSLLASILFAAKPLFYFLQKKKRTSSEDNTGSDNDSASDDNYADILIECAIQLSHHWQSNVVKEASALLAVAFAYNCSTMDSMKGYVGQLLQSIQIFIRSCCSFDNDNGTDANPSNVENVVAAVARLSPEFASSLLKFLLQMLEELDRNDSSGMKDSDDNYDKKKTQTTAMHLNRLIVSISTSNPGVISQNAEAIINLLEKDSTTAESQLHLMASLMACRQAKFFAWKESQADLVIRKTITTQSQASSAFDNWKLYQLARHALVTGNYGIASSLYQQTLLATHSEQYYLWLTILTNIANAELVLSQDAAIGMPAATTKLRSALSYLGSISSMYFNTAVNSSSSATASRSDFLFQIQVLRLRIDFLDLLTGLRQLIREMRLTGAGPPKRTRARLHFQNLVRCFDALAHRYYGVHNRFGLFICQQSRSALRTCHFLCKFMAHSSRVIFSDVISTTSTTTTSRSNKSAHNNTTSNKGNYHSLGPPADAVLPIASFTQRLDRMLLRRMNANAIEPVIRAAAMLELIDGILLTPVPFPRDFLVVRSIPFATLRLSTGPHEQQQQQPPIGASSVEDVGDENNINNRAGGNETVIKTYPSMPFTFFASGIIPSSLNVKAKLRFLTVLLWYRVVRGGSPSFSSQQHNEGDDYEDATETVSATTSKTNHPVSGSSKEKKSAAVVASPVRKSVPYTLVCCNLFPNGNFFTPIDCRPIGEEGEYSIEVILGCRDIRGGEWEVPVQKSRDGRPQNSISVQVSRSGS